MKRTGVKITALTVNCKWRKMLLGVIKKLCCVLPNLLAVWASRVAAFQGKPGGTVSKHASVPCTNFVLTA